MTYNTCSAGHPMRGSNKYRWVDANGVTTIYCHACLREKASQNLPWRGKRWVV